jgi:hypothetical protein
MLASGGADRIPVAENPGTVGSEIIARSPVRAKLSWLTVGDWNIVFEYYGVTRCRC